MHHAAAVERSTLLEECRALWGEAGCTTRTYVQTYRRSDFSADSLEGALQLCTRRMQSIAGQSRTYDTYVRTYVQTVNGFFSADSLGASPQLCTCFLRPYLSEVRSACPIQIERLFSMDACRDTLIIKFWCS